MTEHRPRPRKCGIEIGSQPTGAHDAITDVAGLSVGRATIAEHCTGVAAGRFGRVAAALPIDEMLGLM